MSKRKEAPTERPATPRQAARRPGELDRRLDAELFRALCDPTRLSLLACLARCGRACSVGEIAECCSVDLSVVSRHLGQLARAGVLESHKDGRTVFYGVRHADLAATFRALADALDECSPAACCGPGSCGTNTDEQEG